MGVERRGFKIAAASSNQDLPLPLSETIDFRIAAAWGNARLGKEHKKNLLDRVTAVEMGDQTQHDSSAHPKVVVVILNWNGKHLTGECLESLLKIDYSNYEVLLVDNGSTDGSQEYFRSRHPEIALLENKENLGFAEGSNVGIRRAMDRQADYILLLNNDTVVHERFLSELVRVAESDSAIGFVGPKVYYYDCHGRRDVIHSAGGHINLWIGKCPSIGSREKDTGQYEDTRVVDWVAGTCMLARRDVIQRIGLLDSTFFAYMEEVDWCERGNRAGYTSVFVPTAKIWHKVSASGGAALYRYYLTRNLFLFMKKHASEKQYFSFLVYFFFVQFWISTTRVILSGRHTLPCFLKGVRDGISIRSA
ncbi:MAG: glycosyltransferase family 2 protein [Halobacteriota archaeon]